MLGHLLCPWQSLDKTPAAPAEDDQVSFLTVESIDEIEQYLGDVGRGADYPLYRPRRRSQPYQNRSTSSQEDQADLVLPDFRRGRPFKPRYFNSPKKTAEQLRTLSTIWEASLDDIQKAYCQTTQQPPMDSSGQQAGSSQESANVSRQQNAQAPTTSSTPPVPSPDAQSPSVRSTSACPSLTVPPALSPLTASRLSPDVRTCSFKPTGLAHTGKTILSHDRGLHIRPVSLIPDNPYGYPLPPPFRHNWDIPNRRAAVNSVDPSRVLRAGYTGPPTGSRPRPTASIIETSSTATTPNVTSSLDDSAKTGPNGVDGLTTGPSPPGDSVASQVQREGEKEGDGRQGE
ncbi:hypothetical protein N656DRAFT_769632 [Canariomyces notabilis]|uniref:Uncharacterized protein n=1 Tax=Canariomyces notabilis TaxID=2074819 RepID=A0AAN6TB56_9PEZI|nr:hypothetical protein N656DRAFT_769632 [Canariomyces arenarius]